MKSQNWKLQYIPKCTTAVCCAIDINTAAMQNTARCWQSWWDVAFAALN